MVILYGIKNYGTIKKARRWLKADNIDYHFYDYRVDGLDSELLNGFINELSWGALLSTRGTTWHKLGETTRNKITDVASAMTLVAEIPAIIKRPLLYAPGKPMLLGFSESSYQQFLHEVQSISCPVIGLAQQLIHRSSLSPDDTGCQALLIERLQAVGFTVERMDFVDMQNFWAWRGQGGTLAFAEHTDVMPPGNADRQINPPFKLTIHDGMLFGHGAANMRGSLAAMVVVARRFAAQHPDHTGWLASLVISDEEANAHNGTVKVVEALMACNEHLGYCLVGEPSSIEVVGDVVKNGRRKSLTCNLTVHGVQGRVAYPHLADSPVYRAAPFINELVAIEWDQGNKFFPATSMQIANIQAGMGNNNIVPGRLFVRFNFRFSTELTDEMIKAQVLALLEKHQLRYTVDWQLSEQPFLTVHDELVDAVVNAVEHYNGIKPQLLTTGETLDGRFITRVRTQVVGLGPVNATIHKIDKCVSAVDLQLLARTYQHIMKQLIA